MPFSRSFTQETLAGTNVYVPGFATRTLGRLPQGVELIDGDEGAYDY
jgi:hypothetical protein